MSLDVVNVSWRAGRRLIVDEVSLHVESESMLGVLGPNGSGKSSLLRLLAGLRRPSGGAVLVDAVDLTGIPRRHLARRLAVVEQEVSTEIDLTVAEVVALGRTPHVSAWGTAGELCRDVVVSALERTGMSELADRRWHTLSGGEKQRTQIARALAQKPSELLLDEPTNHLDIAHQLGLLELVQRLPVTSVVALHDLNLAATYCDRLVVMARGRVVTAGTPEEVLTPPLLRDVYGVDTTIEASPVTGRPGISFHPPGVRR
jgi:iron complex transport system ATP-binding protein